MVTLVKQFWTQWRDWSSKTSRRDFWKTLMIYLGISLVITSVDSLQIQVGVAILSFWIILSTPPLLATIARRLNDAQINRYISLILFIPLFGAITLLILCSVRSKEQRLISRSKKDEARESRLLKKQEIQKTKTEIKQKKRIEKKDAKSLKRQAIQEKIQVKDDARLKRCGKIIIERKFGYKKINIFEKGYVSINGSFPEKLISISSQISTTKKTGFGRAVGFFASVGLNAYTSNIRGDAILVIATENKVHSLRIDSPTSEDLSSAVSLETAAKRFVNSSPLKDARNNEVSLSSELERLATLLKDGKITVDEYTQAKSKILE